MGEVSTRDRFRGRLVGLAAGDALGATLEFSPCRGGRVGLPANAGVNLV